MPSPSPRPYQLTAVDFLLSKKRVLLADDMGLGKTCSAITTARQLGAKTLIVCPNFVKSVWWNEIDGGELRLWWPGSPDPYLPQGLTPAPIVGELVVIHYDILHAWAPAVAQWAPAVVIFDEAHALMSENSQRSKAAKSIARGASYVWALTGTPMTSRPSDLWNVVDTIRPGYFGPFFRYGLKYCNAHKVAVTPTKTVWKFNGASNQGDLARRLSYLMLRRTRADVALQLPPRTRQVIYVDVLPGRIVATDATAIRRHLEVAADKKLPAVEELLAAHLAEGRKVVVFTYRRLVAERLASSLAALAPAFVVHGGIHTMRREKAIRDWGAGPGGGLLAATIDTAGTGINLSAADVVVFAELTYEWHELAQAEARTGRKEGGHPVLIQYVIGRGSLDEIVFGVVRAKLEEAEKIVGKEASGLRGDWSEGEEDVFAAIAARLAG